MEHGTMIQSQLPIHNDYTLSSEHGCLDQYSSHQGNQTYTTAGAIDHTRRDALLSQHHPESFGFTPTNQTHPSRFLPDRGPVSDGSSYQSTAQFTDSATGGSISTSPSSAASSMQQYTSYPANHYTTLPAFAGNIHLPGSFMQATYPGARVPPILDNSISGLLPIPSIRSPLATPNSGERETYTTNATFPGRTHLSSHAYSGFVHPETPRTAYTALPFPSGTVGYSQMARSPPPHHTTNQQNASINFPWLELTVLANIKCEGQEVTPEIFARVDKGFFQAPGDNKWTCYRRNYFSVACSFELHNCVENGRLFIIRHNNTAEQVHATGMRLSAVVDSAQGKEIELIQHTPKRDAGPKNVVPIYKIAPQTAASRNDNAGGSLYQSQAPVFHQHSGASAGPFGPYLPLQAQVDGKSGDRASATGGQHAYGASSQNQSPNLSNACNFERVQFKQATANNGKRRASQQYFHLLVEVYADIRREGAEDPVWVKIAHRISDKIVVRGRSPSHYSGDVGAGCQHGQSGSSGRGGRYTHAGAPYPSVTSSSPSGAHGHYGGMTTGPFRSHRQGMHGSPDNSISGGSSSPDNDGGPLNEAEERVSGDNTMSDADKNGLNPHNDYQYYPHTLFHGTQHLLPPMSIFDPTPRYSNDSRGFAIKTEYSDAVGGAQLQPTEYSRFHGLDSSRGVFPGLHTSYA